MLEKTTQINLLYDFYHHLLTEKQCHYLELYYHDDLSLSEIAEQFQVTRQAVFEHIKRAEQLLEAYEGHLQLLAKHQTREKLLTQLHEELKESKPEHLDKLEEIITALKNVD